MKVLVTGGAGRLGYEVSKICSEDGYEIKVLDLPAVDWSKIEELPNIESIRGNLNDTKSLEKACHSIEAVVHLAALLPPRSETDRGLTLKVNVEGTINLLKTIDNETRIIFASSISTYGVTANENPPIEESHTLVAHDNYSESKIMAEKNIRERDKPYTILRIAPVSIADIIELPETVPYKAEQRVEFIYVEDAAHAVKACLEEKINAVYNIGGGLSWQMTGEEYIERFYEAIGVGVKANYNNEYTAVDWYDTSKSRHLEYQKTSFKQFENKLVAIGEELGLR